MKKLISTNPAHNYEIVGEVAVTTPAEIKHIVDAANKAKRMWKELGLTQRIKLLTPLVHEVEKRQEEIAQMITAEMGKPITESRADVAWDLSYLKSFLALGTEYLKDEIVYSKGTALHKIVYEPIGSAAVITPWNFPFDMFLWGVVPNLIAGNTVVFKHSEETPLVGKISEELMHSLHLPEGVFAEVYGDGAVGAELVKQNVDCIWFTGSTVVGKSLFELAGKKFIRSTLEMGGSNPAIVCEDVDVKSIIKKLYIKRFMNNGQVCDAVKRLIVHESIFDQVVDEMKQIVESKIVGDPADDKTHLGSLVSKKQLEVLEAQVQDAINKGATVVTGGKRPNKLSGAYYMPTLLTNIKPAMKVWREEVFGPVLPIVTFKTDEEAIALANDTQYGLGAVVCSKDIKRAEALARCIDAGNIDINNGNHWVASTPFGGYKNSGIGREHGEAGFRELCQIKVIAL